MIRFRQRNLIWLGILGALTAIAIIGADIPAVETILLALTGAAALGTLVDFRIARPEKIVGAIQQRTPGSTASRTTAQAREALSRASSRGSVMPPGIEMLDIGMIALQAGPDGMVMRRSRALSKDDDGVRPFLTLQVSPSEADRQAVVRFEIIDQNGQEQYIHEMRVYMRDGEVNILADHHLRLYGNDAIVGFGDWDLRVYLDGQLLGMHGVAVHPSEEERRNRLGGRRDEGRQYIMQSDGEAGGQRASSRNQRLTVSEDEDAGDIPMTLEQLLRAQNNENRTSGGRSG